MKFLRDEIFKILDIFDVKIYSFIPLIFLFLFLTFLDILSLGLLIPYITFILNPGTSFYNEITKHLVSVSFINDEKTFFLAFSILFLFLFFFRTVIAICVKAFISKFSFGRLYKLQVKLFSSYQNMDFSNFKKKNHSEYIRNIRELASGSSACLEAGLKIMSEAILILSIMTYLFFMEPIPVLIICLLVGFCLVIYNNIFKRKAISYGEKKVRGLKDIYQVIDESFKGFKEIQVLDKKGFFIHFLDKGFKQVYKNDLKSSIILFSPRYIFELIVVVFIISFLASQTILFEGQKEILPIVGVFAFAGLRILPSASSISNSLVMIGIYKESSKILFDDLQANKKIYIENTKDNTDKFESISLSNIDFKYRNNPKKILNKIDFNLNKNETIGLIGETGSGKSTLVDILLGFLKPIEGKVLVNNKLSDLKKSFSQKISYLPQDHLVINNSIEKNITLSIEDLKNYKKINEAIRRAGISKFIESLPNGIKTKIGPEGINLSGGQMKKVCLARLFYHDKDIMILDEATSALDKDSEKNVIEEFKKLKETKTIILISHDYHNLRHCDKIFKIENEKILEVTDDIKSLKKI